MNSYFDKTVVVACIFGVQFDGYWHFRWTSAFLWSSLAGTSVKIRVLTYEHSTVGETCRARICRSDSPVRLSQLSKFLYPLFSFIFSRNVTSYAGGEKSVVLYRLNTNNRVLKCLWQPVAIRHINLFMFGNFAACSLLPVTACLLYTSPSPRD